MPRSRSLLPASVGLALVASPARGADDPPDRTVLRADPPVKTVLSAPPAETAGVPAVLPASLRVRRLDNGVTVVAVPAPTPGIVAVQTWMDVGSRDEVEAGMTGFAHFFEHLMFHGSQALPRDAREARLLSLAVDENAWTSSDHTVYVARAPTASLPELLEIEADRFMGLSLTAEGVRREAGAVYGEFRKGRSDPDSRVWEMLWEAAFAVHPYGHSTIGLEADIAAMPERVDRAIAFHRTFYQPSRATVVVAGDVEPEAVLELVSRTHGAWRPRPEAAPAPERPAEPPQTAERRRVETWGAGGINPRLSMGWRIPAYVPGDGDAAARILLTELLGGSAADLRRRLVDEEAIAWGLWMDDATPRSPGLVEIHVELRAGVPPEQVERVIDEEIARLVAGGPAVDEAVRRARAKARRSVLLELDSAARWASAVGRMAAYGGEVRALDAHVAALSGVSAADVQRVAAETFRAETRTVVHLLPPAAAEEAP
jgi:zinc protease